MTRETTATFCRRWERRATVLAAVLAGLRGAPFEWNDERTITES